MEICVSKSIGLALLCFTLYLRAISKYGAGAYIWRGDLTEGFLRFEFTRLIFGGAYTRRGLFSEFYGISRKKPVNLITLSYAAFASG